MEYIYIKVIFLENNQIKEKQIRAEVVEVQNKGDVVIAKWYNYAEQREITTAFKEGQYQRIPYKLEILI